MANFTDQKPHTVTDKIVNAPWGGGKGGKWFRCYLCGYKFKVGDVFRFLFCGDIHLCNILVCENCDGKDSEVKDRWKAMNEEVENKFWWFMTNNL